MLNKKAKLSMTLSIPRELSLQKRRYISVRSAQLQVTIDNYLPKYLCTPN